MSRTMVLVELDDEVDLATFSVRRFHEEPIEVDASTSKSTSYAHVSVDGRSRPDLDARTLVELARIVCRR